MQDALRLLLLFALLAGPALAQGLEPAARLALAIGAGDRPAVQKVLREAPDAARARMGEGDRKTTMLTYAISVGADVNILGDLLAAGAEVRSQDPNLVPPLQAAVLNGNLPAVKLLLGRGADPNAAFKGSTPLHMALILAYTKGAAQAVPLARALLEGGANPNTPFPKDEEGRAASPLDFATNSGQTDMAKLLRQFGAR